MISMTIQAKTEGRKEGRKEESVKDGTVFLDEPIHLPYSSKSIIILSNQMLEVLQALGAQRWHFLPSPKSSNSIFDLRNLEKV